MKKGMLLGFLIAAHLLVFTQDIHFSQFHLSPLNLNPALTGFFDGDYRFVANYRNQWFSVAGAHPYKTLSASAEIKLTNNLFKKSRGLQNNHINLGFVGFGDRAGDANLGINYYALSISFTKIFRGNFFNSLSLGFQAGMFNRSIDFNAIVWDSQYDGDHVDPNLPSGEILRDENYSAFDIATGLVWSAYLNERTNLYVGGAISHLSSPNQSFLNVIDDELYFRYLIHGGGLIGISDKIAILPELFYLRQGLLDQLNAGILAKYIFKEGYSADEISMSLGIFARAAEPELDAIIAASRITIKNITLGLAYDINVSGFNQATGGVGGFEVSLIYIGRMKKYSVNKLMFCPRF